jgi:1,4-dihydroxy-2-naphthoate octaprenyltransferase
LGTALWTCQHVNWFHFALVLVGAVSAHISVNAFNEHFDFKSGLDFKTVPTPFSGGSGTLPANPDLARTAQLTAWVALAITALIGMYFLFASGLALLPLGLLGLLVIYVYTPLLTKYPLLCLLAPGLGFGPVMVMGTHFALTGRYAWTAFMASLVPFFLVSDLLLLNQFPDVEADQSVGRDHFPIRAGRQVSSWIYVFFLGLAYLAVALGVLGGYLPVYSLLGLLTIFIAVPVSVKVFRHAGDIKLLVPYMGLNVVITVVTPILVAVGLFVSPGMAPG